MSKIAITENLDPDAKLVDEVVDWLCGREASGGRRAMPGRIRADPSGAKSLAHVCVVVPTAQSGRRLRFALAKKTGGGIVPPMVVRPMQLVEPADRSLRAGTPAELAAAFLAFVRDRPRRRVENGRVAELLEWKRLFLPEALDDGDAVFSFFDQLQDIWHVLGAGGLLMSDVPRNERARKVMDDALGDEAGRWDELAELENAYFAFLRERGIRHPAECAALARTAPAPLPAGVETVVLPALADPVPVLCDVLDAQPDTLEIAVLLHCREEDGAKFDRWGRPKTECWTGAARPLPRFADGDIVCAASDGRLAKAVAADFPDAESGLEPPSAGLCDEGLFDALSAAFAGKGWSLHDPEKFRLSASSLGRIAGRLLSLHGRSGDWPWDDFTALLREDDVLRFLVCGNGAPFRADVLEGADLWRNETLPATVPRPGTWDAGKFFRRAGDRRTAEAFATAADKLAELLRDARSRDGGAADPVAFLRNAFRAIYRGRFLENAPGDREFAAALDALEGVLGGFDGDLVPSLGLDTAARTALLRKLLGDAAYSLEPDDPDALVTEGWLELAWSPADKIALVGFREGCVPDSVAGHVFLPERLRAALGLPSNESRLARDTFLFSSILASRGEGDVRAYCSRTSDEGDVHKPSRLLFLVRDEDLAARTKRLFGPLPPDSPRAPRVVPAAWRPRLPDEVPLQGVSETEPEGHLSASTIDAWLRCPLAYLLQYGLGMEKVEEKDELGFDGFGKLVHRVFERYAAAQLDRTARGLPQLSDEAGIARELAAAFDGIAGGSGAPRSVNVRLQLAAARKRILSFAPIQAQWAQDGWNVAARPELSGKARPFEGEGGADVVVKFAVDRVDYKEGVGYRLVDYKTWDAKTDASGHVVKGGAAHVAHAAALGLPMTQIPGDTHAPRRVLSVQLPLYGRCLEAWTPPDDLRLPAPFRGNVAEYCYVVLGKTADSATSGVFGLKNANGKSKGFCIADHAGTFLDTARAAIRAIRANVFWPPGPGKALRYGLGEIFLASPAKDLAGSAWLETQERRLEAFAGDTAETEERQ